MTTGCRTFVVGCALALVAWMGAPAAAQTVVADRIRLNTGPIYIYSGSNSPEGVVTASPGAIYARCDTGSPCTNPALYQKLSGTGNTGWVKIADPATPGVTGSGTTNYLPRFTGTYTLGNSAASDDGTTFLVTRNILQLSGTYPYFQLYDSDGHKYYRLKTDSNILYLQKVNDAYTVATDLLTFDDALGAILPANCGFKGRRDYLAGKNELVLFNSLCPNFFRKNDGETPADHLLSVVPHVSQEGLVDLQVTTVLQGAQHHPHRGRLKGLLVFLEG